MEVSIGVQDQNVRVQLQVTLLVSSKPTDNHPHGKCTLDTFSLRYQSHVCADPGLIAYPDIFIVVPWGHKEKVDYNTSDRGPTQRPGDPDVSNKKLQAK